MKNGVRGTICVLTVITVLLLCACRNTADPLAYLATDLSMVVTGQIRGVSVTARVTVAADGNDRVEYLEPEELKGVCLERQADRVLATLGDLQVTFSRETAKDLFLPADAWRLPREEKLIRRQKQKDGRTYCAFEQLSLVLDENGRPVSVEGAYFQLFITQKG